jgi:hypothetical protein
MALGNRLAESGRTWRTVRHLTARQWVYRGRNRGARALIAARPHQFEARLAKRAAILPLPEPGMEAAGQVLAHQSYLHGPHLEEMRAGRFTFLNRTVDLGTWPGIDWRVDLGEANNPLWRMNLSYFGYTVPMLATGQLEALRDVAALIADFDARCGLGAPGVLRDAWTSFATSFRIVHLLAGWTLYGKAGGPADEAAERVIAEHVRRCAAYTYWMREEELGFNHLLKNLVGLAVFAGCTSIPAPWQEWLERSLIACADEQILADGGHIERSPMYQGLVLQDLLIAAACWRPAAASLAPIIARARSALSAMLHADGEVSLLNDAWIGEAPPPAMLGAEPVDGRVLLPATGYGRLADDNGDTLVLDAGPVGPDSNPGHAHGDFLSFELSIAGERTVVDTGTPTYSAGPLRDACRSARAHNGPRLDGLEAIEAWASFRVGARGTAWFVERGFPKELAPLWLAGIADGYRRSANVLVGRWIGLWPSRQLLVVDCWSAPDRRARTDLLLARPAAVSALIGDKVDTRPDRYWPHFGAAAPATRVSFAPERRVLAYRICWGELVPDSLKLAQRAADALLPHLVFGQQPRRP